MKKNLLYIFADQWRYHAMGCVNEDPVSTPTMDALASESLFCSNATSTYPLCSPHRAALVTGKHPLSLGFWTNCKIGIRDHITLEPGETTITDVLYDAGYENAYIGKYHLDASEMNYSPAPLSGARNWDAYTPVGERRHHVDYWYSYGAYDQHLHPHYWKDTPEMETIDKWSPTHETDVLLDFLEHRDTDKPFSAIVSWNPPHPPYDQVPEDLLASYPEESIVLRDNVPEAWRNDPSFRLKWRQYMAAVSGLDRELKRVIEYLKAHHLYENTILVLSADHGDCMGSHGQYGKNIWWEESLRIPLIIHDPSLPKGTYDGVFLSEDHMPTLLDLLGIEIPSTVQGFSHADAMKSGEDGPRDYSVHLMVPGMPELVEPYEELGLDNRAYGWRAIRKGEWKLVVDKGTSPNTERRILLFNLSTDPLEMNPVSDKKKTEELFALLKSELKKNHDNFQIGEL